MRDILGLMSTCIAAALVGACAQQPTYLLTSGPGLAKQARPEVGEDAALAQRLKTQRTLAGDVLAALAVERVTGRAPEPDAAQ